MRRRTQKAGWKTPCSVLHILDQLAHLTRKIFAELADQIRVDPLEIVPAIPVKVRAWNVHLSAHLVLAPPGRFHKFIDSHMQMSHDSTPFHCSRQRQPASYVYYYTENFAGINTIAHKKREPSARISCGQTAPSPSFLTIPLSKHIYPSTFVIFTGVR